MSAETYDATSAGCRALEPGMAKSQLHFQVTDSVFTSSKVAMDLTRPGRHYNICKSSQTHNESYGALSRSQERTSSKPDPLEAPFGALLDGQGTFCIQEELIRLPPPTFVCCNGGESSSTPGFLELLTLYTFFLFTYRGFSIIPAATLIRSPLFITKIFLPFFSACSSLGGFDGPII